MKSNCCLTTRLWPINLDNTSLWDSSDAKSNIKTNRTCWSHINGMILHASEGKKVVLLPGPPAELIPMFHNQVEPILKKLQPGILYSKVVKIDCMGESAVETEIIDLIEKQTNPTVAPYAKTGEVHLRVTAKAETEEEAKELVNQHGNLPYLHQSLPLEQVLRQSQQ